MAPSELEFLRKTYGDMTTEHLTLLMKSQPMSSMTFDAMRAVLSSRGVAEDQYPQKPIEEINGDWYQVKQPSTPIGDKLTSSDKNSFFIALPILLMCAVGLQILYPAFLDILSSSSVFDLRCTASIHGIRSDPCGFGQLIESWTGIMVIINVIFLGVPTLVCAGVLYCAYKIIRVNNQRNDMPLALGAVAGLLSAILAQHSISQYFSHIIFWIVVAYFCKLITFIRS